MSCVEQALEDFEFDSSAFSRYAMSLTECRTPKQEVVLRNERELRQIGGFRGSWEHTEVA